MAYGYSLNLRDVNRRAPKSLGVRLGRLCIKRNIPVVEVAERLGVSRQTVYNWFRGVAAPGTNMVAPIEKYIASIN